LAGADLEKNNWKVDNSESWQADTSISWKKDGSDSWKEASSYGTLRPSQRAAAPAAVVVPPPSCALTAPSWDSWKEETKEESSNSWTETWLEESATEPPVPAEGADPKWEELLQKAVADESKAHWQKTESEVDELAKQIAEQKRQIAECEKRQTTIAKLQQEKKQRELEQEELLEEEYGDPADTALDQLLAAS
jgi:hypothetical protein